MTERMIVVDEDHAVGVWEHVIVFRWRVHTRAEALRRAQGLITEVARAHPKVSMMHVVEAGALPPEQQARAAIAELIRAGGATLQGTSVVWEGEGFFRGAAVRGVVTGVTMLLQLPSPLRVLSSVEAAAEWHLEPTPGADPAARAALVGFAARLRNELDART